MMTAMSRIRELVLIVAVNACATTLTEPDPVVPQRDQSCTPPRAAKPAERFDSIVARSSESEHRFAQFLEAAAAAPATFEIECHSDVCRLRGRESSDLEAFQDVTKQFHTLCEAAEFHANPLEAWCQLEGPDSLEARRVLADFGRTFKASVERADCARQHPAHGRLYLRVAFRTSQDAVVTTDGNLATDPVAVCLRDAFEKAAVARTFPCSVIQRASGTTFVLDL